MTKSLQKAFKLAQALPNEEQDALAALIVDELESSRRWREAFERSGDKLDELAEEALAEYRAGETLPFPFDGRR